MTEMQYVTLMDPRFAALELIDVGAIAAAVTGRWYNETLCRVNDALVRLGVLQGEYHWHAHDGEDKFFYVVDGGVSIELEGTARGGPWPAAGLRGAQGITPPAGGAQALRCADDRDRHGDAHGRLRTAQATERAVVWSFRPRS